MAQVPVFRQSESLIGFQVTSPTDMLTILTTLAPTYAGTITSQVAAGVTTWVMTYENQVVASADVANIQTALVGYWVVYSSTTGLAICYTPTQFAAIFHT